MKDCALRFDPVAQVSLCSGQVLYASPDGAQRACAEMDAGQIDGVRIEVKLSKARKLSPKRSVARHSGSGGGGGGGYRSGPPMRSSYNRGFGGGPPPPSSYGRGPSTSRYARDRRSLHFVEIFFA